MYGLRRILGVLQGLPERTRGLSLVCGILVFLAILLFVLAGIQIATAASDVRTIPYTWVGSFL